MALGTLTLYIRTIFFSWQSLQLLNWIDTILLQIILRKPSKYHIMYQKICTMFWLKLGRVTSIFMTQYTGVSNLLFELVGTFFYNSRITYIFIYEINFLEVTHDNQKNRLTIIGTCYSLYSFMFWKVSSSILCICDDRNTCKYVKCIGKWIKQLDQGNINDICIAVVSRYSHYIYTKYHIYSKYDGFSMWCIHIKYDALMFHWA